MPRKDNQRKKLLILRDILLRNTDEQHGMIGGEHHPADPDGIL